MPGNLTTVSHFTRTPIFQRRKQRPKEEYVMVRSEPGSTLGQPQDDLGHIAQFLPTLHALGILQLLWGYPGCYRKDEEFSSWSISPVGLRVFLKGQVCPKPSISQTHFLSGPEVHGEGTSLVFFLEWHTSFILFYFFSSFQKIGEEQVLEPSRCGFNPWLCLLLSMWLLTLEPNFLFCNMEIPIPTI